MVVRRDERSGTVKVWTGLAEFRFLEWAEADREARVAAARAGEDSTPPEPTLALSAEEANELVVALLRGPVGPPGPMGLTGASGQALGDGMA